MKVHLETVLIKLYIEINVYRHPYDEIASTKHQLFLSVSNKFIASFCLSSFFFLIIYMQVGASLLEVRFYFIKN